MRGIIDSPEGDNQDKTMYPDEVRDDSKSEEVSDEEYIPVVDIASTDDDYEEESSQVESDAADNKWKAEPSESDCAVDSEWEQELEKQMAVSSVGSVKAYACPHPGCPKFFSKTSRLKTHQLSHTGERPFACDFKDCDASYTRRTHLKRHIQSKHELKAFSCPKCSSVFKSSPSLSRHLRIAHENRNRYGCENCKKTFPKKSFLKKHICGEKTMEEVKKVKLSYACTICDLKFQFPNKLKAHLETHTKKKCQKCEETFSTPQELRKHVAKAHKHRNVCHVCDKEFSQPSSLNEHLTNAHQEIIPMFNCPHEDCDSKYTLKRNLTQHIKVHHSDEAKFTCPQCGKKLNHKRSYDRHLELHKTKGSKMYVKEKKKPQATRKDKGTKKKSMLSILTNKELTLSENKSLVSGKVVPIEAAEVEKQIRSNPDLENEMVEGFEDDDEELTGDVCARQKEMYEEIFLPKMLKKMVEKKKREQEDAE